MFDGNDRAAARDFVADEIGRQPFADRDELHLGRDLALARVVQLRDRPARRARRAARRDPRLAQLRQTRRLTSWPCGPLVS